MASHSQSESDDGSSDASDDELPPSTPSVASSGPCSPVTRPGFDPCAPTNNGKKRVSFAATITLREYLADPEEEEQKQVAWQAIKRSRQEAHLEALQWRFGPKLPADAAVANGDPGPSPPG